MVTLAKNIRTVLLTLLVIYVIVLGYLSYVKYQESKQFSKIESYKNPVAKIYSNEHIRIQELQEDIEELKNRLKNYETTGWVSQYDGLFQKYFGKEWKEARAVCKAESGLQNIRSHKMNSNGTYDWGLCQINDVHKEKLVNFYANILDPEKNIQVASIIWRNSGKEAWVQYNNNAHAQYIY